MRPISFKRHRFPPEIIRHAIWLYARFTLSFRDVEELLAERGIDASYETVRRWFLKFGPSIAANIRRSRPRPSDHWHLDEMVISIRGGKYWLWRAVDNEGEVQSAPIVGFPLLFLGLIAVLPSSALALPVVYGDREYCATSSARRFRWQPLVNLSAAAYSSAAVRAGGGAV